MLSSTIKNNSKYYTGTIVNCYDSHVHWCGTGEWARQLSLKSLRSSDDLRQIQIQPYHFRGHWLVGRGWDQNLFSNPVYPNKKILDQLFPNHPVYFVRADGHAAWVNSLALQLAEDDLRALPQAKQNQILRDEHGHPTGIVLDHALQCLKSRLPKYDDKAISQDLLFGQAQFLRAGFTHIRDLTGDEIQWAESRKLEDQHQLLLKVEQFFGVYQMQNFDRQFDLACRTRSESTLKLQSKGVKVFMDGALGSEGAWVSHPYLNQGTFGLQLLADSELREIIRRCYEHKLELAIHVIGDEAAHRTVLLIRELTQKNQCGRVHLEHVQLLRPETLRLMRGLDLVCHMQPCHWLSDKAWLKNKIGDLIHTAFRWRDLESIAIPTFFGSDSPVEPASVSRNWEALQDAAAFDIPMPQSDFSKFHSFPQGSLAADSRSEFVEGSVRAVYIHNQQIDLKALPM